MRYLIAILILTLSSSVFAKIILENKERYKTIDILAALPEDEIDIGYAGLVLAKEIFPDINIQDYSAQIDKLVDDIRGMTQGATDPDYRIRVLNSYLYLRYGMQYDRQDLDVKKLSNRWLSGLLDTRKGSCATLPLLYLAVAQRLGYPIYPVHLPRHYILRYVDPWLEQQNIEATGGGGFVSDEEYTFTLKISDTALRQGTYLKTLTYREYLGLLIEQNGIYWAQQGDLVRAIYYLETAVRLNPRNADGIKSLGLLYKDLSKENVGIAARAMYETGRAFYIKATEMGVTQLARTGYMLEQKQAQAAYKAWKQQQQGK